MKDKLRILAVETSCDETAVSIIEVRQNIRYSVFNILSNIVASQIKIHAPWGGVVPNLAKREHIKNLPVIFKRALKQAKISEKNPRIDLIAVTSGPGLEPSLWVGINFAENLAKKWKKPLMGINHLEGHIMSVLLPEPKKIKFPALALIVSGGHTELVLIKKWLKYKVIGQTLDDAAGEAFDKVAKMLGLGYPGGPAIGAIADKAMANKKPRHDINVATATFISTLTQHDKSETELQKIELPRPMINSKDYNFSFSGLKTAVLYKLRDLQNKNISIREIKTEMAAEFQQAAIDVLIKKTIRAAKEHKVKTIILGGGVAANKELRKQLEKAIEETNFKNSPTLLMPEMKYTGDNAAMIALAAYFRAIKNKKPPIGGLISANGNLELN